MAIDLRLAIDKLPSTARDVLRLRLQGWTVSRIASTLGLSVWKTRQALRAGLAQINGNLKAAVKSFGLAMLAVR
jgi:DNA-directed RNA polymerase specialized sigma24 family protein